MSKLSIGLARPWWGAEDVTDVDGAGGANDELTFVGLLPQWWQLAAATLSEVLPRCAGQVVALDVTAHVEDNDYDDSEDTDCDAQCNCTACIEARAMACVLAMEAL